MESASFLEYIERLKNEMRQTAADASKKYFETHPTRESMIRWLGTRCWREIDYVFLINAIVNKYWSEFDPKIVTSLMKQSWDEARHYQQLAEIIELYGGKRPLQVTEVDKIWSKVLWDSVDKDKVAAISGWHLSETSGEGTFKFVIEGAKKWNYTEVSKAYEKIAQDELFHLNLGHEILERYAIDEASQKESIKAAQQIVQVLSKSYGIIFEITPK